MRVDVATFSPLKPPSEPRRSQVPPSGTPIDGGGIKRRRRWMLPVGLLIVAVAVLGVLALVFVSAKASLETDANGIAKVGDAARRRQDRLGLRDRRA